MKRFQKIFAFILTACMLCGMIVTLAFADSEPGYVHPTLTNAAATNIANNNLESYTVGNSLTSFSGLSATRYANSSLTVGSETVDGAGNKFWKVSAPTDELNVMYTGSNRTNQRSSYFQFKPNSAYAKPNYYIGVYDTNRTDAVTPVVNNFDYLTIDYDFSAQGARVEYVDGTYGRANALTNGDDGSVTVTLTDGTVVSTNAAKNETTVTATDGTVTVWTTDGSTVTETVTASDSSKVVSVTVVAEDGSAEKTVTSYDAEGAVISTSKVTRSAVVNGGYTIIYDSGRSIVYATSTVVIDAKTGESTTTETYTVTEGENVTVYTYTNYRSSSATAFTQTLTYVKTVNGVEEYSNVSSFPYNSGSASHTNKAIITVYNAEVEALADEFSVTDLYGMHIKDTRIAYGETSL